jgi:hypothetical protein
VPGIVAHDAFPHRQNTVSFFLRGQSQGVSQGPGHSRGVIRIDEEGVEQFLGRAGKLAQNQ